jgi:hypothetical protein
MKLKLKFIIILLAPLTLMVNLIVKNYPDFVERYFSDTTNRLVRQVLSLITGVFPFSIAEFLVLSLVVILVGLAVILIIKIVQGKFEEQLINTAVYLSLLYVLFMFLWGFNYNRLSFDKISGLKIEKSSKEELYELCQNIIDRANKLRANVVENSKGVMTISGGYRDVFSRAAKGYENAVKIYPQLGGSYGDPKPILLSERMSYTGITGIYIPYTGEANVNVNVTDFTLPATTLYEMAHQRGFAREDEANYIAYVACLQHPDSDFRYSGIMLALVYSMNALAENDMDAYKELRSKYSEGVLRDLKYDAEFWNRYRGKVEKISNKVNNTYLKSNGQEDGVESYGRMVDLLIAEYKSNK